MTDTLPNDPISNLPEPYRLAWEIFQDSDGYENVLRKVLTSAQKLANADWVMLVINNDSSKFSPGFYCLPDTSNITVPVGDIASLAYALAMHVIENPRHILIENIDEATNIDSDLLIKTYISAETRDHYVKMVREGHMWRPFLEITDFSPFTCMVIPAYYGENILGAFYLHRSVTRGSFSKLFLDNLEAFVKNVAPVIKSFYNIENAKIYYFKQLAALASEIRVPILSIEGYAKILREHPAGVKDDLGENTATENEFLDVILKNTRQMHRLLNYMRMELDVERNLKEKKINNPRVVIDSVLKNYHLSLKEKSQTVELILADEINVNVLTSSFLFSIVAFLIENAHLYTPASGNIKIFAMLEGGFFVFRISDNGYGLTEDEIPNLFQKHYRSYRTEIQNNYGLGISLFTAKKVVEASGGQVGAEGSLNQGSTFWFRLPITIKE